MSDLVNTVSQLAKTVEQQSKWIAELEKSNEKMKPKVNDFNDIDGKVVEIIRKEIPGYI